LRAQALCQFHALHFSGQHHVTEDEIGFATLLDELECAARRVDRVVFQAKLSSRRRTSPGTSSFLLADFTALPGASLPPQPMFERERGWEEKGSS